MEESTTHLGTNFIICENAIHSLQLEKIFSKKILRPTKYYQVIKFSNLLTNTSPLFKKKILCIFITKIYEICSPHAKMSQHTACYHHGPPIQFSVAFVTENSDNVPLTKYRPYHNTTLML